MLQLINELLWTAYLVRLVETQGRARHIDVDSLASDHACVSSAHAHGNHTVASIGNDREKARPLHDPKTFNPT